MCPRGVLWATKGVTGALFAVGKETGRVSPAFLCVLRRLRMAGHGQNSTMTTNVAPACARPTVCGTRWRAATWSLRPGLGPPGWAASGEGDEGTLSSRLLHTRSRGAARRTATGRTGHG